MNADRLRYWLRNLPTHVVLVGLCLLWILPALGLLVTSLRPFQDVNDTGWWTVLSPPKGAKEYAAACAECHGDDGKTIAVADLTSQAVIQNYRRSITLVAALKKNINGQPHMGAAPVPNDVTVAAIATYLRRLSGIDAPPRFTQIGREA